MTRYAEQSDFLEAMSQDSQARIANDPTRKWRIATAGDGVTTTFTTPFMEAATVVGYVSGVVATGTLSKGTGTGGVDRYIFDTAPAAAAAIDFTADKGAINLTIVNKLLDAASGVMNRYLVKYLPISDPTTLTLLTPVCVTIAKCRGRARRDLELSEGLRLELKEAMTWLTLVLKGDAELPIGQSTTPVPLEDIEDSFGSETEIFGSPDPYDLDVSWERT